VFIALAVNTRGFFGLVLVLALAAWGGKPRDPFQGVTDHETALLLVSNDAEE
jgi:hypothetical protein